eukprot:544911_1
MGYLLLLLGWMTALVSCETECSNEEFKCYGDPNLWPISKELKCIPISNKCDGTVHCGDESDETQSTCENEICEDEEFQCKYGACIWEGFMCDNVLNCHDGSDESYGACFDYECLDDEFQCDYGGCVPDYFVCKFIDRRGKKTNCLDGSDEGIICSNSLYLCTFADYSISMDFLTSRNVDLTENEADITINVSNMIDKLGLNLQDAVLLLCLLFINIISGLFIIIGLYGVHEIRPFEGSKIHYMTLLIIILQHLLLTSINIFYLPIVKCVQILNYSSKSRITWFELLCGALSAVQWFIWFKHIRNERYMKYVSIVISVFVFALPIVFYFVDISSQQISSLCFVGFQCIIPFIWITIVSKNYINTINRITNCTFHEKSIYLWIGSWLIFTTISVILIQFGVVDIVGTNSCFALSGGLYLCLNPMMILIIIGLILFTESRCINLLYIFIILMISLFDLVSVAMCYYVINVQFVIYSLFVPVYIVLIFFTFKELKQWKMDIISTYLVSFDVISDILVIYKFVQNKHYQFAALQISFIAIGQIIGSFSDNFSNLSIRLTKTDKLMAILGFARPWFLINSWKEGKHETATVYTVLFNKHRIWEIIYESFPSIALQIYALFSTNADPFILLISMSISVVSLSFGVWMYFVKITKHIQRKQQKDGREMNKLEQDSGTESQQVKQTVILSIIKNQFGHVLDDKLLFLNIYGFMMSDFYVRSIPFVAFLSAIPCNDDDSICMGRTSLFIFSILFLLILEFICNYKMRVSESGYRSIKFIFQIFAISILSSFYNLLCTLEILKDESFFGQSVQFKQFLVEHRIRMGLSTILLIGYVVLFSITGSDKVVAMIVLIVVFAVFVVLNILTGKQIQRQYAANQINTSVK